MKNILITAGLIATATTGVILYLDHLRKRQLDLAQAEAKVHHEKKTLRDYLRKSKLHLMPSLS